MRVSSIVLRHAAFGVLFGAVFIACALVVDWFAYGRIPTPGEMLRNNPLHLIVGMAPIVLGAVFAMLGRANELRLKEAAARREQRRGFEFLVEGVTDYAIYMIDPDGKVLNWNAGAQRAKGYEADEIVGKDFSQFYTPEDRKAGIPQRNLKQALSSGHCRTEGWRLRKDGSRFWANVAIQPVRDRQGTLIGYAKITRDRTEQMENERRLKHGAWHDSLTGLPNRAHFLDKLDNAISLSVYDGRPVAVACIDLDSFSETNDTLGHGIGDDLLAAVGGNIAAALREGEAAGRFGGDEFIAMKTLRGEGDLEDFVARIEAAVNTMVELPQRTLRVSASIGFAAFPDDAEDRDGLVNNADLAMHRAKASASATTCRYERAMDEAARDRRALANDIPRAMEAGEFFLHYQPQCSVTTGEITGYEALIRWRHPEKGMIPPDVFIPVAEQYGMIVRLGDWVIETACREAGRGLEAGRIAVNLSGVQLSDPDFADRLWATLLRTGTSPMRLELEVTETAIISDSARALRTLRLVKTLGVTLALDDFGTGYASLDTLQSFPFDKIKLDRGFVSELGSSDRARAIVRAVLALGRSFEIPVLAEGIETEMQLDILRIEGCQQAQGYLLGRPARWTEVAPAGVEDAAEPEGRRARA